MHPRSCPLLTAGCLCLGPAAARLSRAAELAGDQGLLFNTSYLELHLKSAMRWFPDPPDGKKLLVKAVDDGPPEVLMPYAWGSHGSRLVDVIRFEHHDLELDRELRGAELNGSQVNFTRPELSPCLAKFTDPVDPAYQEALAIIQGRKRYEKQTAGFSANPPR